MRLVFLCSSSWPVCTVFLAALLLQICSTGRAADAADEPSRFIETSLSPGVDSVAINGRTVRLAPLRTFYAGRAFAPAWTIAPDTLNDRGRQILDLLAQAGAEGLHAPDYRFEPATLQRDGKPLPLDIAVSARLLLYATDVGAGRSFVRKADPELFLLERSIDGLAVLRRGAEAADPASFFETLAPASDEYRALKRSLKAYRLIALSGGWPAIAGNRTVRPGEADPALSVLRRRLQISGDMSSGAAETDVLDGELLEGLRRFQMRHGLAADGTLGPKTRTALNIPAEQRIRQIELNMERWRWLEEDLGESHVFVNLAGFYLKAVRGGKIALRMPVIVGKTYRRTPAFSDRITYIELNPVWTVPYRNASQDILPKLQADPSYLAANGFELLPPAGDPGSAAPDPTEVDWSRYRADYFPFRLRQAAGPLNALGTVKFMFPNRFAVYLHDTPARELFSQDVRTFSSGCIRVAQPVELSEFLLNSEDWRAERVSREIGTRDTRVVRLPTPVPVHLAYLTAFIEADGILNFRDDVYGRDKLLAAALLYGK